MTTRTLYGKHTGAQDLTAGTEVTSGTETYLIKSKIGQGGFGTIYRATFAGTNYALKVASGAVAQKKLLWESQINAVLSGMSLSVFPVRILRDVVIRFPANRHHTPRSCSNSDFVIGVIRDLSNFGTLLTDILKQENDLAQATELMLTIIRTLEPIHEDKHLQYIHGDISPENIIYVPNLNVALFIDFGSAQRLDKNGFAKVSREEFSYNSVFMSPEVRAFIESRREEFSLSKASDIYSLGMIFYGLLFEPPTQTNCEHIGILVHNRINQKLQSGMWSKATSRLVAQFFADCLAIDEESRIKNLDDFSTRILEIVDLLQGKAISGAGIYHQLLMQSSAHMPQERQMRGGLKVEDPKGLIVNLADELRATPVKVASFLFGTRGSGKTSVIRRAAQSLLESGDLIPIYLNASELLQQKDLMDLPQSLATAVYRNVFGVQDSPEPALITRIMTILGFSHEDSGMEAEGTTDEFHYALFIDNFNLLEVAPSLLSEFAVLLAHTTATQFVLCGNHPAAQSHIRAFWSARSRKISYALQPLSVDAVQDAVGLALGKRCPEQLAKALSTPVLLSLLFDADTMQEERINLDNKDDTLSLGSVAGALNRFYRADYDMLYGDLPQFAYSVSTVRRAPVFELDSEDSIFDRLKREELIRPAHDVGYYRFYSSVVASFLAAQFIIQTVHNVSHVAQLASINHIWDAGLVAMLREIHTETLVVLASKLRELVEGARSEQISDCDLIPANLFALTGDNSWAFLSAQLADSFFHETVLDGYFTHKNKLLLYSDIRIGEPVLYDLRDGPEAICSRLPPQLVKAIAADVRYGFRLTRDPELADALDFSGVR